MKFSLFFLLIPLLFGCKSAHQAMKESDCKLPENLTAIDGLYKNAGAENDRYSQSLLYLIDHSVFSGDYTIEKWQDVEVSVSYENKRITFSGMLNDSVFYKKSYRATKKKNYLKIRRIRTIPFFPLFYRYYENLYLLSVNENGDLILLHYQKLWGGILLFMVGNNDFDYMHYKKLNP